MKFKQCKGNRIKSSRFVGIMPSIPAEYGFDLSKHKWVKGFELTEDDDFVFWEKCHSLKSALRKVKRAEVPKGTVFILCGNRGKNIYITK